MLTETNREMVMKVLSQMFLDAGVPFTGHALATAVIEQLGGEEEATGGYSGTIQAWMSDVSSYCRELFFTGKLPGWGVTLGRFGEHRACIYFPVFSCAGLVPVAIDELDPYQANVVRLYPGGRDEAVP